MKHNFFLVVGVVVVASVQAAGCSSNFDSCSDTRTCASSAGSGASGVGEAGQAPDNSAAGAVGRGEGGDTGDTGGSGEAGEAGAAGAMTGLPMLFGSCAVTGMIACQNAASAQRLACDGQKWQPGTTCADGQLCDSDTGACAKVVSECAAAKPGQVVCRGDKPLTCGADLVTADEATECAGTCKDGVCQAPTCGDKKVEPGEDCDDDALTASGACVKCKKAACGDGALYAAGLEQCDDGNTLSGDGCSATCSDEAVALALGDDTSCALSAKGVLKCWGDNQHGALGAGDTVVRGDGPGQMGKYLLPVQLGTNRTVKGISSADWANCAVLDNGQVKCWGQNAGQLGTSAVSDVGDGPGEMDALGPVDLGAGRSAKSVSIAAAQACAVLDNASLKCWGVGAYGVLGQGDVEDRPSPASLMPVNVGAGRTVQMVSASHVQSCALLDDGSAKCWGNAYFGSLSVDLSVDDLNASGNVGDSSGEMALLPGLSFGSGHTVKSIVGGTNATCAILDDNRVRCWGADYHGELGQESASLVSENYLGRAPAELSVLPAVDLGTARTAKMISFGYSHVCAVLDNGSVKCWGGNESGQLGIGNTSDQGDNAGEMGDALKPVPLGPGRTAHFVATGKSHSCAILDDGTVACWGLNDKGQLGRGNIANVGDAGGLAGVSLTAVDLTF